MNSEKIVQELEFLDQETNAVYQATKSNYESGSEAWDAARSLVTMLAKRWGSKRILAALELEESVAELIEDENISRSEAIERVAGPQPLELKLEGSPLVVKETTTRRDGTISEELLLTNGRDARVTVELAREDRPGIYFVRIMGGKGGRSLTMSARNSLQFSGLISGETLTLSVNPETDELNVDFAR